jgi:hypothetical protein
LSGLEQAIRNALERAERQGDTSVAMAGKPG